MIIIVPTVKKTGTGFMAHSLLNMMPRVRESDFSREIGDPKLPVDNYVLSAHPFSVRWPRITSMVATNPSIVPLRHPDAVTMSWERRGWDTNDLRKQWAEMESLVGLTSNNYFLRIDHPDRDADLAAINAGLGLTLTTDWAPMHYGWADGARSRGPRPRWVMDLYA